jgi:hypothetical protein
MYKGEESKPVHGYLCAEHLSQGWTYHYVEAKQSNSKKEAKETEKKESVLTRNELAKSLGVAVKDKDGKPLHYKLIDSAIKEAQANEHNEG